MKQDSARKGNIEAVAPRLDESGDARNKRQCRFGSSTLTLTTVRIRGCDLPAPPAEPSHRPASASDWRDDVRVALTRISGDVSSIPPLALAYIVFPIFSLMSDSFSSCPTGAREQESFFRMQLI